MPAGKTVIALKELIIVCNNKRSPAGRRKSSRHGSDGSEIIREPQSLDYSRQASSEEFKTVLIVRWTAASRCMAPTNCSSALRSKRRSCGRSTPLRPGSVCDRKEMFLFVFLPGTPLPGCATAAHPGNSVTGLISFVLPDGALDYQSYLRTQ
jgi:hypothetical protein